MKEKIEIRDRLGHRVSGILSTPKNPHFIVVMSHGFTSNRNTKLFQELEKELNSKGIGTVRYEYYGHGRAYGHKKRGLSNDVTITKSVESLRAVIKHVRRKGYKDIALVGSSFGGLLSIIAASREKIKFLAIRSPVTDPVTFWNERISKKTTEEWKKRGLFRYDRLGEDYTLKWDFWKDMHKYKTGKLAKHITCPVFIVHGDKDDVVPIKYSKAFAKLTGAELFIVKDAEHRYLKKKHYKIMKAAIKNFIISQAIK